MFQEGNGIMTNHRKKRTRAHVIAELSLNHVEYFILKGGFSVERIGTDYGYDLQMYTYDDHGEVENGTIYLQLKATDNIQKYEREKTFLYPFQTPHLRMWRKEPYPVIAILFDAGTERAYWIYVQAYLEAQKPSIVPTQKTFSLPLEKSNLVNAKTVRKWRKYKNNVLLQLESRVIHYA
jgi:hypothetical protein